MLNLTSLGYAHQRRLPVAGARYWIGGSSIRTLQRCDAHLSVHLRLSEANVKHIQSAVGSRQSTVAGQRAVHGVGSHFDPSASFLKSDVTTNGMARYSGSVTIVITIR